MKLKFFNAFFFVILTLRLESIMADESSISSDTATASSEGTTTTGDTDNKTTINGNLNSSEKSTAAPEGTTTAGTTESETTTNGVSSNSKETTAAFSGTTKAVTTENESTTNGNSNTSDKSSTPTEQTTAPAAESTTTKNTAKPPPSFTDNVSTSAQNLLGINCMVQTVYNIEDAVPDFTYEIGLCGSRTKKEAAKVLHKVKNLETYIKKVKQVNKSVCKNENYKPSFDAAKTPTANCVKKIQNAMNNLNTNVDLTIQQANKYLKLTTNSCASMALLKFRLTLNNFSASVNECARLAEQAKQS